MKKILMPLVVLAIAGVVSVILYFTITEIHRDWQTTTGTITNIDITFRRKHAGKRIHYYWTYTVDGVDYSGYDVFAYDEQLYAEGDEKEIWYNPDNPSESQFTKPSPSLYVYIPFVFALPVMLAVYDLHAKKERKSLHL